MTKPSAWMNTKEVGQMKPAKLQLGNYNTIFVLFTCFWLKFSGFYFKNVNIKLGTDNYFFIFHYSNIAGTKQTEDIYVRDFLIT